MFARSDAPLIEHLARRDIDLARAWQRPPLVLLPPEGWAQYLIEEQTMGALANSTPTLDRLLWDDAVYDLGELRDVIADAMTARSDVGALGKVIVAPTGRGRAWVRVRTLAQFRETPDSPWWGAASKDLEDLDDDRWLVCEWWDEVTSVAPAGKQSPLSILNAARTGLPRWPDIVLIDRQAPWSREGRRYLYPGTLCQAPKRAFGVGLCHYDLCKQPPSEKMGCIGSHGLMGTEAIAVTSLLAYLARADEHPVEQRESRNGYPTKAQKRQWRDKPWTRTDLPSVVLVDLSRVAELGHPSALSTDSHASPRPHARRGHWRRLKVPDGQQGTRKVWVRQSWIGATTWDYQGTTYSVITATGPTVSSETVATQTI
jgi:hypothetical protein